MRSLATCAIVLLVQDVLAFSPRPFVRPLSIRPPQREPEASKVIMMSGEFGDGIGSPVSPGGFNSAGEAGIEIRGFSLAKATLAVGLLLTIVSFGEFFLNNGGSGLSSLGFIYGIPITLIGCSLQYAELEPAGVKSTPALEALFEKKGTETMKKIVKDTTRHRYGDEAHLDTTVKALGLVLPGKAYPQMKYIEYASADGGELSITCVFQSLDTAYRLWVEPERVAKYNVFFGPDVWCDVVKVSAEEKLVGIKMTTGARPVQAEEATAEVTTEVMAEA
mmetsp:Transcript_65641/g.122810  ORF Transcript_65641/g.122810 Transcript_65641/m.122810 type:complete len:277 (-) Transcript_65641:357-1187(-)